MNLGTIIKELRQKHNLTQRDLAAKLGVWPLSISRWETNNVKPSKRHIRQLCKIFNVESLDSKELEGCITSPNNTNKEVQ